VRRQAVGRKKTKVTAADIKAAVRERDGHRCTECGTTAEQHYELYGRKLEVHRLVPGSPYTVEGSVTLCKKCHGPKPRSSRYSRISPVTVVKIDRGIFRKAKVISAFRGMAVSDYLAELLAEPVHANYAESVTAAYHLLDVSD
jgi:hypothetical protein